MPPGFYWFRISVVKLLDLLGTVLLKMGLGT